MSAFELVGQSPAQAKAAAALAAEAAKQAARRAAAPSPDSFVLTGSNRAADALPGHADLFSLTSKG
jgi:hypothetical protein